MVNVIVGNMIILLLFFFFLDAVSYDCVYVYCCVEKSFILPHTQSGPHSWCNWSRTYWCKDWRTRYRPTDIDDRNDLEQILIIDLFWLIGLFIYSILDLLSMNFLLHWLINIFLSTDWLINLLINGFID